jgi:TldD protein
MNPEQLIKKYADKCELIEFWNIESENESIIYENKSLKSLINSSNKGISARILVNGCFGFASSNDSNSAEKIFKKAYSLALNASRIKKEKTILKDFETNKCSVKARIKIDPFGVDTQKKIDFLKDFHKNFDDKLIKNNESVMGFMKSKQTYVNSFGSRVEQESCRSQLFNEIIAGNPIENVHSIRRASKGYELFNFDYGKFAKDASDKIKRLINAKNVKPGKYNVILNPEICGTFFHEAIGHALEADALREKNTCVSLGEQVSTEELTLYDNPTIKGYWGSYEYDDEGIKSKKNTLIKNGKIVNFMNDLQSYSDITGLKKTANARMQGIHDVPIVRMSNTEVKRGKYSFDELIEKTKNGMILKGFGGGAVEPITGIFSFKANEVIIIKNGKISGNFKGASLSGDLKETLKNITGIGKEITNNYSGGMCGKKGQSVPVSESVPYISVRDINVTN